MSPWTLITLTSLKVLSVLLAFFGHWHAALVVFFGPDLWVFYNLFVPSAQGLCPNFTRFETAEREVWLTIDDGPDPDDTPKILELLDRHQARATFSSSANARRETRSWSGKLVRRGHEVGHHTQTHPAGTLWCASRRRLMAELDQALAVLQPLVPRLRWFRAPVGIKHFLLPHALRLRGLQCVGWTLRSGDCLSRSPEAVERRVMRRVKPGAIILMHEGPSVPAHARVRALSLVMESLASRGYRCVLPAAAQLR